MKTSVLLYTGMMTAFLDESCWGYLKHEQKFVLKTNKSTVTVHCARHDI
jgi:hypothetical protein